MVDKTSLITCDSDIALGSVSVHDDAFVNIGVDDVVAVGAAAAVVHLSC